MKHIVHMLLLSLYVACAAIGAAEQAAAPRCASAEHGIVVCDHRLAAQVGAEVLKNGGNAIDAAVATAFALAVTLPQAGNIGGGGFLVFYKNDGNVVTVDFREKAPMAATTTMFLDEKGKIRNNANHEGLLAVGVPGTVAGLALAHERFGTKPWAELVQPAVDLAVKGFAVSRALHEHMRNCSRARRRYPSFAAVFLKDGRKPYAPGETWRQPELAKTLELIRDHGRDGFYHGRTARLIVATIQKGGGIITLEDLAAYRAVVRKPIHGRYRGYDVYAMGPPSSGGIALVEMLNILDGFDLKAMGHNSPLYMHVLTEAMRRAFADRARHAGDPDFNPKMPVEKLLSESHADALRRTIDMKRASKSDPLDVVRGFESNETTHISIVDARRNAVSLTYTLEQPYGSKIVVEGAGFLLNNEMGDFNPIPGHTDTTGLIGTTPNLVAAQKRMLSSMTPTIVARNEKPVLVIGTPGGRTIINTVLQVVLNIVDHEMSLAEAIEAGRFHHQWLPDVTSIETRAASWSVRRRYAKFGHKAKRAGPQGRAMGVFVDHKNGTLQGVADSRSPDGAAAGY